MKSNIAELYHNCIDEYRNSGAFKIEDLIDNSIMPELKIRSGGEYNRLLRDKVRDAITSMLNLSDCYRTDKKGEFVWLEKATLEQLSIIEKRERDSIRKKEKRLDHINNKIQGQITFIISGNIIVGTEEEKAVNT